MVEDNGLPSLWSVGSADIWHVLQGDENLPFPTLNDLIEDGFEYLQVLGTSNVLEKCFDCFVLGLA